MRVPRRLGGVLVLVSAVCVVGILRMGSARNARAASIPPAHEARTRGTRALSVCGTFETITPCTPSTTVYVGTTDTVLFEIDNNGSMDDILDISCIKPGILSACSVTPAIDTVKVGRSKQVKLIFSGGPASGTGVAVVDAEGNVELEATDTIKLNPIKVTPKTTIDEPPDTTYTQSFTVKNLGNAADTVNLAKACSASLTCTLLTPSPMPLAAGASGTANVSVTTMSSGTSGTVTLSALPLHGIGGDTGTVSIDVPVPSSPEVSSSPHNGYNRSTALCAMNWALTSPRATRRRRIPASTCRGRCRWCTRARWRIR